MRRVLQFAVQVAVSMVLVATFSAAQARGPAPNANGPARSFNFVPTRPSPAAGQNALFGPPASIFSPQAGLPFGPPPSVTSLGPTGYTFAPCVLGNCGRGRHGFRGDVGFAAGYPIFVPYYVVPYAAPVPLYYEDDQGTESPLPPRDEVMGTQGASSIMYSNDRHTMLVNGQSNATRARDRDRRAEADEERPPAPASVKEKAPPPDPPAPQDTTTLVFKDGHKIGVTNYVIKGGTLFNYSGQGPRRIAIADLDVQATVKTNEENGVVFRLP
jgi:hypothetical protein